MTNMTQAARKTLIQTLAGRKDLPNSPDELADSGGIKRSDIKRLWPRIQREWAARNRT